MKALITGDRKWTDKKTIYSILAMLHNVSMDRHHKPVTLIHGDCPTGADKIADDYASMGTMNVIKYPPDWKHKGRAAGPIRNSEMLKEKPDLCIGFHNDIKKSKGTRDTLKKAKKAGIPTFLVSTKF